MGFVVPLVLVLGFGCSGGEPENPPENAAAPSGGGEGATKTATPGTESSAASAPARPKLDADLQTLVLGLESENATKRMKALREAAKLGTRAEKIYDRIVALKADPDPDVRLTLVGTMVELRADKSVDFLGAILQDESSLVREEAVVRLGQIRTDGATRFLLAAMDDEDAGVRAAAIHALGTRGTANDEVIAKIEAALDDLEGPVIREAVAALGLLGVKPSASRVAQCLLDRDDGVRQLACAALARLGVANDDTVIGLIRCLDDDSYGVRDAALQALLKLTGSEDSLGYDPAEVDPDTRAAAIERWQNTWKSKKEGE